MERPDNKIIFLSIFLLLSEYILFYSCPFSDNINRIFYQAEHYNTIKHPNSYYQKKIYKAYITGDMYLWQQTIDSMEYHKTNQKEYLLSLVNYTYGYIGWSINNNKKQITKKYITRLSNNLNLLKNIAGESIEYHTYTAALYGFKIGINPLRAPILGPLSFHHCKLALQKDSLNFYANYEMGNIWYYMPKIFGGSPIKALIYYQSALQALKNELLFPIHYNWMYLNLLLNISRIYQEIGDTNRANIYYYLLIDSEPNLYWINNELLPPI